MKTIVHSILWLLLGLSASAQTLPPVSSTLNPRVFSAVQTFRTVTTSDAARVFVGATADIPSIGLVGVDAGETAMLNVNSRGSLFAARLHADATTALMVSAADGQAAKFIQNGYASTGESLPTVRIWRGNRADNGVSLTATPVLLVNDTSTRLDGTAVLLELQRSGVSRFYVDGLGNVIIPSTGSFGGVQMSGNNAATSKWLSGAITAPTATITTLGATTGNISTVNSTTVANTGLATTGTLKVNSAGTTVAGIYSASASLDFPSIAANTDASLTITVTGAATTNTPSVAVGWSADLPAGVVLKSARVHATNGVTIVVRNVTASPIDPPAITCRATVFQF